MRPTRALAVLVVTAPLLLAACGSDSSDDSAATTDAATATTLSEPARHHDVSTDDLATWQGDLNAVGCWVGPVDGELGPRTEAATREFQEAKDLTADGLLGGQTETALQASVAASETVCVATTEPRPVSDASIHELEVWQHDLNAVGCWAGPEDGTLGPQTEAAIRAYQSASGLTVDGKLGPQTEEALAESAAEGGTICTPDSTTADDGGGAVAGSTTTAVPDDGGGAVAGSSTTAVPDDGGGAVAD